MTVITSILHSSLETVPLFEEMKATEGGHYYTVKTVS